MDLINTITGYGPWAWVVAGMVLLALELVVPGGVLVWMGASAIATGLAMLYYPLDWPVALLVFGVLSIVLIVIGLRYFRPKPRESDTPFLNQRAERFVGQVVVLSEPIAGGFGRVMLDDTTWRVSGPDLSAGTRVRVIGHAGPLLKVEAL